MNGEAVYKTAPGKLNVFGHLQNTGSFSNECARDTRKM